MQQVPLNLDDNNDPLPESVMTPTRQEQLIALMADAIVVIVQRDPGDAHETE